MMRQAMITPRDYYVARRRNEGKSLLRQTLGTLLVLGALVMMANG